MISTHKKTERKDQTVSDKKKTGWTQIRYIKMSRLIWIQTVDSLKKFMKMLMFWVKKLADDKKAIAKITHHTN